MKKKLAMLMASLFLVLGTVWAQTQITAVSQLSNDKVYSIVPKDVARGALYATSKSTYLDACGGTYEKAANKSVTIDATSADQQFAFYKHNEQIYLYSVGAGKFLSTMSDRYFPLVEEPGNPVSVEVSDTEGYFIVKIADNYVNVSTGWSAGCVGQYNQADDGNRLLITEVADMPAATLEQLVEAFTPITSGTKYALRESTTGLFLDIQTLNINEPNAGKTTNNISLNATPCIIYFEAGTTDNTKWTLKNANGTYAMQPSERNWNAVIGTTAYEWTLTEAETDLYTIARADGGFIGADADKRTNGAPLYCNIGTGLKFSIVEYTDLPQGQFTLKTNTDTYLGAAGKATGLVADGVYTIQGDANGQRGYMAAGENYATYPILSDITLSGYTGNSVTAITNGKNWYVCTMTTGTYLYNIGLGKFLVKENGNINFGDTPYAWTIKQNGSYTSIYDNALGKWLSMGCGRTAANRPIAWDTNANDGGAQHTFTAVTDGTTYTNQITTADVAIAAVMAPFAFSETAISFKALPSAGTWFFEKAAEAGSYIGYNGDADATAFSLWTIGEADYEGFSQIARATDATKYLGSAENTNAGTAITTSGSEECNAWSFEGTYDCTTTGTATDGKYHFTSDKMWYPGVCNKLRFTLTESGAFYKGGAKRLSFDSFVLYDANGEAVTLAAKNVTGNNIADFTNMLDGTDGTYSNYAYASGTEDDWFEITLPYGVDLGGAFSFSFVTENTTMNAKAFRITTSYEAPEEYTFNIEGNGDNEVTVTLGDATLTHGALVNIATFDADAVVATDLSGYTWSIAVDNENATITLTYTEATITENPASVVALVNRIGGSGTDAKFKFVHDPSMNSKQEVFSINGEDGKIVIKGTTLSAITTGLGWYLNHHAHINIAWNSLNEKTVSGEAYADLSDIPVPTAEETHVSDAKYRYYLNTCTFGYSMTSWTWKRWQQEIDWMALHGINMPLQLVGLEEVWRSFLTMEKTDGTRKYGYTDEEAKAFVAGPAFIAWWAMNNLEGWGGTAAGTKSGGTWEGAGGVQDDAWYVRQKNLAKQILARQRELGMQPVLPGWSGMVPTNFASKSGYVTRGNGGNWAGDFVRPLLLSVSNANYADIAADYYTCLNAVMGESQYYSMDPFHEGGGAGTMEDYEALYAAMEAAKPGSQWVIQQWQWSATQKYSLTAVPAGRLIVLDLFSDGSPAFDSYNGYAPQEAVFCAIPNFGGRSGLMGRLQNVTDNYFAYKTKYASIKGIGTAPEAIEQTPVTYDLIYQLPWMNGVKPDVTEWVNNYAIARYGVDNEEIKEAWNLLRQGPLAYGADGIQGPVEDVWAAVPNLTANKASSWGVTINNAIGTYTKARQQMLISATYKLLEQSGVVAQGTIYESNLNYDLVEFGGAVFADYAYWLLKGIGEAKNAGNTVLYESRRDAFLALILDVDAFKGTNLNFRLGKWTQEARDAAGEVEGATTATPDWYEYNNARTIVSTWSSPGTNLNDYSYRSWQGLLKDLYYPRWKYYFDNNCTDGNYNYFAWNWAHGMEHYVGQTDVSDVALTAGQQGHTSGYTRNPEGNTVEKATEVLAKYIIPVVSNSGTYYAYRYLTNDLSSICTVIAGAGTTIDLSSYFGELTNATITGDFIEEETSTNFTQLPIKSDAADGAHTGTITLADGTVLTFAVVINPGYYGAYYIDYQNNSADARVFVGYNEDKDNANNVGYKFIATGTYTADAEADKIFTIVPNGSGYSLSAQGKYLKSPNLSGWNHLMFSDNAAEAGAYIFEETNAENIFKMCSTGSGINYVNDYDKLVFGNDNSKKENLSTFKITPVETYSFPVSEAGMATLCLPFHVVLPEGMVAYDLVASKIENNAAYMDVIANAGNVLLKGTPVIVKATPGDYELDITMDDTKAKGALTGSLLCGNFVKQDLTQGQGTDAKKFIFANGDSGVGFYIMSEGTSTIAANKCWLELPADANVRSLVIRFSDDATDVEMTTVNRQQSTVIYNLAGQRLAAPQKGINIINGVKVVIK